VPLYPLWKDTRKARRSLIEGLFGLQCMGKSNEPSVSLPLLFTTLMTADYLTNRLIVHRTIISESHCRRWLHSHHVRSRPNASKVSLEGLWPDRLSSVLLLRMLHAHPAGKGSYLVDQRAATAAIIARLSVSARYELPSLPNRIGLELLIIPSSHVFGVLELQERFSGLRNLQKKNLHDA